LYLPVLKKTDHCRTHTFHLPPAAGGHSDTTFHLKVKKLFVRQWLLKLAISLYINML